ncbi:MAG: DNA primase family protein, partial [Caldisphaera sp.]
NIVKQNFYIGIDSICPSCHRKLGEEYLQPGKIAEWLLSHYKFATTEDEDQSIFLYSEKGIWEKEIVDPTIKKELTIIYGGKLTGEKFNNVKLNIQAKTYVSRSEFSSAIKQVDNEILINVRNGVLHYPSMKLTEHSPDYYFFSRLEIDFKPDAPTPEKFLDFLGTISLPNEENFVNLLEAFAYPLLPGYPIQRAIALIGAGQNGKSTFLKAMETFYGEKYISHLTMQQLSSAIEGQPFALTRIIGKIANIADDLPSKPVRDVGYFKQLTGGSSVEAERKFGSRLSFVNTAKFYFAANQMPAVSEDTIAFYRRFLFIEFSNIIEKPRDQKEIMNEICSEQEKSGLLNLLLLFVIPKLLKNNDFSFAKNVDEIAEQYQKHSNTAQLFCEKRLEYDPESSIKKEDLWQIYEQYCQKEGLVEVSQKMFWSTFAQTFPQVQEQRNQENGIRKRTLVGIKFMEDDENDKIINLESENSNNILEKYFNISYSDQYDQYVHYFCLLNKDTGILKSIKKERENLGHDGYTGQQQSSTSNLNIESSTETL